MNSPDLSKRMDIHTGSSMSPTLRAGDVLTVAPYHGRRIRPGDVISFRRPGRARNVVHRVVRVGPEGVRTRGDNNIRTDTWVLESQEIIGRVVSIRRKEKPMPIYGGARGRLLGVWLRALKQIDTVVSRLLHPLYHGISRSGILRRCLPPSMSPRVLTFNRPDGAEYQLVIGRSNRIIGRRLPGDDQWRIQRPFRLFIDEGTLPNE